MRRGVSVPRSALVPERCGVRTMGRLSITWRLTSSHIAAPETGALRLRGGLAAVGAPVCDRLWAHERWDGRGWQATRPPSEWPRKADCKSALQTRTSDRFAVGASHCGIEDEEENEDEEDL